MPKKMDLKSAVRKAAPPKAKAASSASAFTDAGKKRSADLLYKKQRGSKTWLMADGLGEDEALVKAFRRYDLDGDGAISRMECEAMVSELRLAVSAGYVERAWGTYDTDGSGALEWEEFSKMMKEPIFANALELRREAGASGGFKTQSKQDRVAGTYSDALHDKSPINSPYTC